MRRSSCERGARPRDVREFQWRFDGILSRRSPPTSQTRRLLDHPVFGRLAPEFKPGNGLTSERAGVSLTARRVPAALGIPQGRFGGAASSEQLAPRAREMRRVSTSDETGGGGRFTHINEAFRCEVCGQDVPPRASGCRNHCPFCLASKHVDVFPGDRLNPCQGVMDAVDYELDGKKGLMLLFRCRRCGARTRNMAAREDPQQADLYDRILALKASGAAKKPANNDPK
jgi:hypothetical protein